MNRTPTISGTRPHTLESNCATTLTRSRLPFCFCYFNRVICLAMRQLWRLLLSLLVTLTFLVSTLAVCNAHLSAREHPDCARCLVASTSRRDDGMPVHLPVGPHHCPDHACGHLHLPFLVDGNVGLIPLITSRFFLDVTATGGREPLHALLRPPRA